jgi:hypothetical protein
MSEDNYTNIKLVIIQFPRYTTETPHFRTPHEDDGYDKLLPMSPYFSPTNIDALFDKGTDLQ